MQALPHSAVLAVALLGAPAFERHGLAAETVPLDASGRLRFIIETDAGGDPDDEQSLVRFLLYTNEWDVEGIIANRALARDGENKNPERTGLGVVRRLLDAYGECHSRLVEHDPRYPTREFLRERTVAGYDDTDSAVNLLVAAVDRPDPRPLWYADWGSDQGAAGINIKRALDRVLRERGQDGYASFKNKLRVIGYDQFGEHTKREPDWRLWVNTFQPPLDGKRWYHRFSALTATAGGFDLARDVLTGHGPLGALYPTNTTHTQKEGDTPTFLYLVPTGMNNPDEPGWGSWAGRYGPHESFPGKPYYWANQVDTWNGVTSRDNTLGRWAAALQNDFRARLSWCVKPRGEANHPPRARVAGELRRVARPGENIVLDAQPSSDPDGNQLAFSWFHYAEVSGYAGPLALEGAATATARFRVPHQAVGRALHFVLAATDDGSPPLTRYQRVIVTVSAESPSGLAAKYPGDRGIDRDSAVLFAEDFEQGVLGDVVKRWTEASNQDGKVFAFAADAPPGSVGKRSLEMTATRGKNTGGHLYKRLPRGVERLFARFHVKFDPANDYTHHFVALGGYHPATNWPQGGAGVRPLGNDRIFVGIEPANSYGRIDPPGMWSFYTYWHEMKVSADGKFWGQGIAPTQPLLIPRDRWQCVEVMVRLNSSPEKSDGELVLWLDGVEAMRIARGTPRGPWTGMGFDVRKEGGEPFEGFRWRTSRELELNYFWLLHYVTEKSYRAATRHRVWFDDVVVATEYIGPIRR